MNLWFRLLWLTLTLRRKPAASVLDEVRLPLRVLPNDLDLFLHMNNGRYLTLMDLGRFALMYRTGLLGDLRRIGGTALLGGILVYYIRPLSLFQRVDLYTQVVSWDDKWIYLEHRMVRGETLHARAIARVLARDAEGNIPTRRLLERIDAAELDPPQPVPAAFARGQETLSGDEMRV